MKIIYSPDVLHSCALLGIDQPRTGTIGQCEECGKHWCFRYTEDSWGPVWTPVRWWHLKDRRRIRQFVEPEQDCLRPHDSPEAKAEEPSPSIDPRTIQVVTLKAEEPKTPPGYTPSPKVPMTEAEWAQWAKDQKRKKREATS